MEKDAKKTERKKPAQGAMEDKETVEDYLMMDVIGRGAFGVVFRAVHRHRGNWVAIKQVKLNKKKKTQLNSLMMEIDLLKSLKHKNIVHYIDHICNDSALNIIMEYVENGSLESLLRKHGKFPESLVSAYMAQVVEGLVFLHDQCVIHRDIKGANILITTAGHAKLADFGVSTKLSDISNPEDSFAGTPYWMAPEIITMSGATTACDIWSVGCTIIELLTGTPPYGNLPAAASLYRIVQDDHPPLPEGITPGLHELLLLCFQKDVDRRITAEKLMRHPWIMNAKAFALNDVERQIEEHHTKLDTATNTKPLSPKKKIDDERKGKNERKPDLKTKVSPRGKNEKKKPVYISESDSDGESDKMGNLDFGSVSISSYPTFERKISDATLSALKNAVGDISISGNSTVISKSKDSSDDENWYSDEDSGVKTIQISSKNAKKGKESEEEENWYSDEETATPKEKKTPNKETKQIKGKQESDEESWYSDEDTKSTKVTQAESSKSKAVKKLELKSASEEDESWVSDEDSDNSPETQFVEGSNTVKVRNLSPPPLKIQLKPKLKQKPKPKKPVIEVGTVDLVIEDSDSDDYDKRRRDSDDELAESTGLSVILRKNKLENWNEEDEDGDFMDGLEFGGSLQLKDRVADEEVEDAAVDGDPFDQIMDYSTDDADAMLQLQKLEILKTEVVALIAKLNPYEEDKTILDACNKLINVFKDQPDIKPQLINNTTIIQTLNLLEASEQKRGVLSAALKLVNEMLNNNNDKRKNPIQANFCLLGGIPAITKYASPHYPKAVRLETAQFISQMSQCNPLVLHMFIACGGLSVLTTLLETHYNAFGSLIKATIDSIWNVFHIQILPKNDFCHLFSKCGLMEKLAITLGHFYHDPSALEHFRKTCDIMFYFSQASLDTAVQKTMCTPNVLKKIKEVLSGEIRPAYHVLWLLHTVRNLSMHINARSALESAGFLPELIRFLKRTDEFTEEEKGNVNHSDERENVTLTKIHNQVLSTVLNICQMDYGNHEKVALAGIIPSLMWFIEEGTVHFLKELALKLFLAMPHSSPKTRDLLWECDSFRVYMKLLQDSIWYVDVLQCLLKWRRQDYARVDEHLESKVEYLIGVFDEFCGKPGFQKAVEPLLDIVQESASVSLALTRGGVIPIILAGLKDRVHNPHVQCNLLKILLSLLEANDKQTIPKLVKRYDLVPTIKQIHSTTNKLLVKNIAQRLLTLEAFQDK